MNKELIKYYGRTYLSPKGEKHVLYPAWQKEWEQTQGIVYIKQASVPVNRKIEDQLPGSLSDLGMSVNCPIPFCLFHRA